MRIALVTPCAWKTLPERMAALSSSISKLLPAALSIEVVQVALGPIPVAKDGRVDRAFLKKSLAPYRAAYDGACLLFERGHLANPKDYTLGLQGYYLRDEDGYLECFVMGAELQKEKSDFGEFKADRAVAHELAHGLFHWIGYTNSGKDDKPYPGNDSTHYWDKRKKRLAQAYREIAAGWPKPKAPAPGAKPSKLDGLPPKLAEFSKRLLNAMKSLAKDKVTQNPAFVYEGCRSDARQMELWLQGRDPKTGAVVDASKVVTNAKPGQSLHNRCQAVDVVFDDPTGRGKFWSAPEADWEKLGMMGKSIAAAMGIKVSWGGDWKGFKDRPHFEIV